MEGQAACSRSIQIKRPLNTPTKPNSKREANFSTPLYKVALTKPKDFSKIFTDGNETLKPTALKFTEEVHSVGETSDHSNVCMPPTERKQEIQDQGLVRSALNNSVTLNFRAGMSVSECELLLCSLLVVCFPTSSFRARYYTKYSDISKAIYQVSGVLFDPTAISNYLYRSNNNLSKGLGKTQGKGSLKSCLRWKACTKNIGEIVKSHQDILENLCSCSDVSSTEINQLREDLKKKNAFSESTAGTTPDDNDTDTPFTTSLIETIKLNNFPNWKTSFNSQNSTAHLFYFGGNSGYCEVEVIINDEGFWKLYLEGKQRMNINLEWLNIPSEIAFLKDIKILMLAIQSLKICAGCKFDNYETFASDDPSVPVYHTRSGEPAAFVENNPFQHHKKVIRSTFCLLFVPHDELLLPREICAACEQTQNYLRTLKSRNAQMAQERKQDGSKFTRFDYLRKDELLDIIRKRTKEIRYLQDRIKKLEKH